MVKPDVTPILPSGIKANLRFSVNYRSHKAYLLKLDRTRFTGLGEDATKAFVRHGMVLGDRFNLRFVEEVQYLLFMMYFLGSYFYEDPRYSALARILNRPPSTDDHRIKECHALFVDFSDRYLADDLSIYASALENFGASTEQIFQHPAPVASCIDAFFSAFDMNSEERNGFPSMEMVHIAENISRELGLSGTTGTAACLSLSFWIGTGFYADPLYPWIHDVLKDVGHSPAHREAVLRNYASKRMRRQISALRANALK